MKAFGWSLRFVRFGITGAESWVWYNWAIENEITAFGALYKRKTDGYVRQETKRLVKIALDAEKKRKK
jgi:hypothetical protein